MVSGGGWGVQVLLASSAGCSYSYFLLGFSVLIAGFICCCLTLVGFCCVIPVDFGIWFIGGCVAVLRSVVLLLMIVFPLLFGICLICLSGCCFGVLS